jgi:hypothetical protein
MNATRCGCSRKSKGRAVQNSAGWVIPGIFLALLPKCPLCLAAALSVIFGIGLSADAARVVHGAAIILCALAIIIFVLRQLSPWFHRQLFTAKYKFSARNTIKL